VKKVVKLEGRALRGMLRSRYVKRYGFRCWNCGKGFEEGEEVVVNVHTSNIPKYYCMRCARRLGI